MTTLTAKNGREYQLGALVNRVEYGEETLAQMTARLGAEVAAEVEKEITARERSFSGRFVKETPQAWLFRSHNGDCWLPKKTTRIVTTDTSTSQVVIAISPSLAARIDNNQSPTNLLTFTTKEAAQRLNVTVETVRKWIREGLLSADSISGDGAAFEYRIPEEELQAFMCSRGMPSIDASRPRHKAIANQGTPTFIIIAAAMIVVSIIAAIAAFFV